MGDSRIPPAERSEGGGLLRGLLSLSAGDLVARVLSFAAFVYLARVLGVEAYGTLEFALSLMLYLTLLADGGLELWATREAARTGSLASLAGRVVGLRLLLSLAAAGVLLVALPFLPDFERLPVLMAILAAGFVVQALNLKWVALGREEMSAVARAAVAGKLLFAGSVVLLVSGPESLVTVAVLYVAGDAATALYYGARYASDILAEHGRAPLGDARAALREAFPLGASQALGLLSYNFDTLFLGFLVGAGGVGLYNAAYKPVVAVLAIPLTCFTGLMPSLSRLHAEEPGAFARLTAASVQVSTAVAVPIAVGGTLLAGPIVELLFGEPYAAAGPVLAVLAWSAALVVLRGSYHRALQAADRAEAALKCAGVATALNLGLNLALIPPFGLIGAAWATVAAEVAWLSLLLVTARPLLPDLRLGGLLTRPVAAGGAMAAVLALELPLHWTARGAASLTAYCVVLFLVGWRPPTFEREGR